MVVMVVVVAVVVQTRCSRDVFIHITARMHRIEVTEHLGVGLLASPQPTSPRRPTGAGYRGLPLGLDVRMDGVRNMQ